MKIVNGYNVWGDDQIDPASHDQMLDAVTLPVAVGGALMADAHVGYGLPIGGVLALDNAVCPFAVGVDIGCRMAVSIYDLDPNKLDKRTNYFVDIIENNTYFGVGKENQHGHDNPVLHKDWSFSQVLVENKEKAIKQLGTSGSGNHFVEFCLLEITAADNDFDLPIGVYIALMSHSGSRGVGAAVCNYYSGIARATHPEAGHLAWLELGTANGDEYFAAMNIMGEYAKANHDCIHNAIEDALGIKRIKFIENHHNFAWKEEHNGKQVVVHRKGATPAGQGVFGVIPGSMGTPAYIVKGLGNPDSLCSASHGAGRQFSRKKAKEKFSLKSTINNLKAKGIHIISAGADEAPGAYKDIEQVMAAQTDLVKPIGKLYPKIVKMSSDGRAED